MTRRRHAPLPNLAARARADRRYKPKVAATTKHYSRKIKHRKGRIESDAPFFIVPA